MHNGGARRTISRRVAPAPAGCGGYAAGRDNGKGFLKAS
jgi:hypothetical protein